MDTKEFYLFPQKIISYSCDMFFSYQRHLVDYAYRLSESDSGFQYTSPKGWQSKDLNVQDHFDPFRFFLDWNVRKGLSQYGFNMDLIPSYTFEIIIMNLGYPGSYHNYHVHPGGQFSGVLWVKVPHNSGTFKFNNRSSFSQSYIINRLSNHTIDNYHLDYDFCITPEEGKMLLFPPNLAHSVDLNQSDQDRVSLVFNVVFPDLSHF